MCGLCLGRGSLDWHWVWFPTFLLPLPGRVARAGRSGTAYSLVAPDEMPYVFDLHLFLGRPLVLAGTQEMPTGKAELVRGFGVAAWDAGRVAYMVSSLAITGADGLLVGTEGQCALVVGVQLGKVELWGLLHTTALGDADLAPPSCLLCCQLLACCPPQGQLPAR